MFEWTGIEFVVVGLLIGYIIAFVYGWRRNFQVAKSIAATLKPVLDGFKSVGSLEREAVNIFEIFACGHGNFKGLLVTIDLKAEQDLLSVVLGTFGVLPWKDKIKFEVQSIEGKEDDLTAGFGRKAVISQIHEKFPVFTKTKNRNLISKIKDKLPFVGVSDCSDTAESLFGSNSPLGNLEISSLAIIDSVLVGKLTDGAGISMIADISINSDTRPSQIIEVAQALLATIEGLATLKLSQKSKAEIAALIEAEQRVKDEKEREEKMAAKRQALTDAEKEKLEEKRVRRANKGRVQLVR